MSDHVDTLESDSSTTTTDSVNAADAGAGQPGISITATAAGRVKEMLAQQDESDLKLRIAVQPGGCSGLSYQLYFDERDVQGDVVSEIEGVTVAIDPMSAPYLDGATIDYIDDLGFKKQGFTIDNPNSSGGCSCGDSFSCG